MGTSDGILLKCLWLIVLSSSHLHTSMSVFFTYNLYNYNNNIGMKEGYYNHGSKWIVNSGTICRKVTKYNRLIKRGPT